MRVRIEPAIAQFIRHLPPNLKREARATLDAVAAATPNRLAKAGAKQLAAPFDDPSIYRLVVGPYRLALAVTGRQALVFHAFPRSAGYGWLADLDPSRLEA